ncbi:carbonic anhydrase 1-like isoform X2 [Pseudomyrmex gracilis]|uniref:carbonic anhydrase 1-like isoform X2 n=1 Tax=Pseudomyrmex gracilis TaxID=219809 RepID=UPI0009955761|nr:carbonic anhydrase 1-like isoform X2 [Pseudomyrmex gracilis]
MRLFCLIALLGLQISKAAEWGFSDDNGPQNWPGICTTGKRQSPIDIVTKDLVESDLDSLDFDYYDVAVPVTMINNGHSVQIGDFNKLDMPIVLRRGNLPSTYILEQMHFHWDAEHTIDGVRDPLELHIVHYNEEFGNFTNAAEHKNGLVVIGILFELDHSDNPVLKPILDAIKLVSNWVGKSAVSIQKLVSISLLPENRSSYYRYQGSLTTPNCQESVIWIILADKIPISKKQLNVFKNVDGPDGPLKSNFRPTQKLGDRNVYYRQGYNGAFSFTSNIMFTILNIFLIRFLHN